MLRELHIQNLAVIEDLTIELGPGLNCFTGQTGAGKSLILGAFEILLGLRQGADMLRPGADEARVWGIFEISDPVVAAQIASVMDTTIDPGEDLLITRKIFASGRSSVSINGQPATGSMVRAVGELLVDIHGQHDHQFLLKPSNQLIILDTFARAMDLRDSFGDMYARARDLLQRKQELQASTDLRRQQLELLEFQAQEIDDAQLVAGEFEELRQRHALLSNLEKVKRDAGQAYSAMYDAEGAVVERLQMISHILSELAILDPGLNEISEAVRNSTLALQDSAFDLNRYVDRLDLDPRELAEIEDRLNTVNRLISKYAGSTPTGNPDPIEDVIAFRAQVEKKLEQVRSQNVDMETIDAQLAELRAKMLLVGEKLTKARQAAGAKIKPLIEAQLKMLGMADAEFHVQFTAADVSGDTGANAPAGIGAGTTGGSDSLRLVGSPAGLESLEMLVCTNPGQPIRPLRKIASGGELSRIMLALKSILAESDRVAVLVFDEIDSNIGGRMGTVIGQKLSELARGSKNSSKAASSLPRHQVLCITHLPQIAAYADRHFRIAKTVEGEGKEKLTRTLVTVLTADERIEELAEMLTGKNITQTTRQQVREMIESAGN